MNRREVKPKKKKAKEEKKWFKYWGNMPEYEQQKMKPYASIRTTVDAAFVEKFRAAFGKQFITTKIPSLWYPSIQVGSSKDFRVIGGAKTGQFPIYIVSKGRATQGLTSRGLVRAGVPHYIVVEPQEYEAYKKHNDSPKVTILKLNMSYKANYDTCDALGDSKGKGPGGARNFCWDHSMRNGYKWHWVMDDNMDGFYRINRNQRYPVRTGAYFKACEDFVLRFSNIAIAGLNYLFFVSRKYSEIPLVWNTRIYSCLLIRNDIPYRWRCRYNEDTDLSLRVLKDGWCTLQFNWFSADKVATQRMKGGNTDEFYAKEGTGPKSQMLYELHPDVTKVVHKFGRIHHQVNYSKFQRENEPLLKKGAKINREKVNEYGTYLIKVGAAERTMDRAQLEKLKRPRVNW